MVTRNIIMQRRLLFILVLILSAFTANAVSFTVNAPRQVIQGQMFNITFVLEDASGSSFTKPEVKGCKFIYGPSISQSMSSYNINGKVSSSSSESRTLRYKAETAGTYTIGAASIIVDGKTLKTNPYQLQILPPDKSTSSSNNNQQSQSVQVYDIDSQTSDKSVGKNDVFVRIILSKSQAYEQEGLTCTIKLYTKYDIQQFMPTLQPSFNGFISQELPITASINQMENYNGDNYMVAVLKQCILFPQQSGELTITSGNYDLTVIQYETVRSMFGMMRRPVEKKIKVKSNSATIKILPLPEPKPADFCGAVGNISATTSLLNNSFKTNESGTLRLVIKGSGNLKNIKNPQISFPTQFDAYDPQATVDANPSGNYLSGSVTIDYAFVPQYVGKYKITPGSLSYFNLSTKKYEQIKLTDFNIEVAKGSSSNSIGTEVKQNKDIRFIKNGDLNLQSANMILVYHWGYILWYIIPLLAFLFILFYYRKLLKERSNIALMKNKKANKVANKRLKVARNLMNKNKRDEFYEELLHALWGYLSDKLTIPVSELNRDNIKFELDKFGASEDTVNKAITILDECEFARYASSSNDSSMQSVYEESCDLINSIENTKRK